MLIREKQALQQQLERELQALQQQKERQLTGSYGDTVPRSVDGKGKAAAAASSDSASDWFLRSEVVDTEGSVTV